MNGPVKFTKEQGQPGTCSCWHGAAEAELVEKSAGRTIAFASGGGPGVTVGHGTSSQKALPERVDMVARGEGNRETKSKARHFLVQDEQV